MQDSDNEWHVDYSLSAGVCIQDKIGCIAHVFRDKETAERIVVERNTMLKLTAALDSQEFYELMQTYRHASLSDQSAVAEAFEAVKAFIRNPTTTQPDAGEGR